VVVNTASSFIYHF